MIKVLLHAEGTPPGGPTHHVKNILKYLDRNEFEVYFATTTHPGLNQGYMPHLMQYVDPKNFLHYNWEGIYQSWDAKTNKYPDAPAEHPLWDFINDKGIQILHDYRAGEFNFPLNKQGLNVKKVETNVFGGHDPETFLDVVLPISHGVMNVWRKKMHRNMDKVGRCEVMPLSTDYPYSSEDLRSELGIPRDAIVIGRSSNGYAGDSLPFQAFARLQRPNLYFVAPSLGNWHRNDIIPGLNLSNFIELPVITSYERMSKMYNTLDILAHERGESFGCAVAEAEMHGVPVISRGWTNYKYSDTNAQEELFPDGTWCATGNDHNSFLDSYTNLMRQMIEMSSASRKAIAWEQKRHMYWRCNAPAVISRLGQIYKEIV